MASRSYGPYCGVPTAVELSGERGAMVIVRDLRVGPLAPPAPPVGGRLPGGEPELVFAAGPGIRRLISGELSPAEAIDQEELAVVAGDATLLERFAETFHIAQSGAPGLVA